MSKRILILGGGFAGVYTAMYLEKVLAREPEVQIDLVNRENYFVFQPMLPEVISGRIEILHVINPIRGLCKKTNLYVRDVEHIDLEKKTVTLSPGFRPQAEELHYDYLVLAMGNISNFNKMPGLQEHGFAFRNLGDALLVRNHIIRVLEEASIEKDPGLRRTLLTFVVAGGGFSGVESAAELNDFVRDVASRFHLSPNDMRVILLHSGPLILEKELERGLAEYAQKLLQRRGVEIRFNTYLAGATAEAALITDKAKNPLESIPTRTLIVTVGSSPHPLLTALPCPQNKNTGKIITNEYLEVPGYPGVWALGDCAQIPRPGKPGEYCPPTAQFALRQGRCAADNILASIRGTAKRPFAFSELGKMGALGHRSAVAEVFGIKLSGLIAWVMWRTIYLMKMPGLAKVRVGVDWFLDMLLPRDIVQIKTLKSESIDYEHFEPGQFIFHEGDLGDRVYVIIKGQVQVLKKDGAKVAELGPEDVFGEMALLANVPRNATVQASTPVDVMTIGRKDFTTLLAHVPALRAIFEQMMRQRLEPSAQRPGSLTLDAASTETRKTP